MREIRDFRAEIDRSMSAVGSTVGSVAAVDLGATSGRVMVGHVGANELRLEAMTRFANQPVAVLEGTNNDASPRFGLHWNILELYRSALDGLAAARRAEPELVSVGIDSWAVDYALLRGGRMLGVPYHYRDERTGTGVAIVHAEVDAAELYRLNGLQHLPFNTLFQLAADQASGDLSRAESALLIPDLLAYWLTGVQAAEITNASTTGLLDPITRRWNTELAARVGVPAALLPVLIEPGQVLGRVRPEVSPVLAGLGVVAVGSHDTASAVVAVPATEPDFAYISSGTWSLVGVELEHPVVSEAGRAANFTNEGGVDGRVRYLKNVSGLWLLSESVRAWEGASGHPIDLTALLVEAAAITTPVSVFDAGDDRFLPPGNMPARIAEWCTSHGMPAPQTQAEFTRSIVESLAAAYAATIAQAQQLTGKHVAVVHIVGGGSQNTLLCQLTADRTARPVLAGPVEATAIGNVLVQARAAGFATGSLESLRALVSRRFEPTRYEPTAAHTR